MRRLLVLYVIIVVLLSSFDITYSWLDPLTDAESAKPVEWYSMAGLRNGAIFLGNHESAIEGLSFNVHLPMIFPIPFYAGAGPEGGSIFLSVWFIVLMLWIIQWLLRRTGHSLLRASFKFGAKGS